MKKYNVVIELIRGYYPANEDGDQDPIIERKEFEVMADSEKLAIEEAKKLEVSTLSVWESYAEEVIE